MKKMSAIFLCLSVFPSILACITKREEVPADFQIRIEDIFSQPQPGTPANAIEIRCKVGTTKEFELIQVYGPKRHIIDLKYEDVLRLYREIVHQKIMKMKERYSDMSVLDGGTTDLQLKMNGKEKRILLRNTTPPQLENFFALLNQMQVSE
jgi:hypothetical protein